MDADRANELVAKRRELESKVSALLDEYREVLIPSGSTAVDWWRVTNDPAATGESIEHANHHLGQITEGTWDGWIVRGWVIGAEIGPVMINDLPTAFGAVSPAEQSPLLSKAIHHRALGAG